MWRTVKRLLAAFAALFALVLLVVIYNTLTFAPVAPTARAAPIELPDPAAAAEKLSQAVRFRTVRGPDTESEYQEFLAWLEPAFPDFHRVTTRQILGGLTPLYTWKGRNSAQTPVLLAAHYDVVPAGGTGSDSWRHAPFSGDLSDGFVWGRGSLDNKGPLVAMLEAANALAAAGFQPERTIYFSLGHDEETGGETGAAAVIEHLIQQGVEIAWSLDEGSFVLDQIVKGIERPIASINLAQKGSLTLTLTATAQGGHSSMPPRETAVSRLAAAIVKLQANPVPGGLTGLPETFFDALAPDFPFVQRAVFANKWLFRPLIEYMLSQVATTNATIRTTTAPTMLSGSDAHNKLPTQASAKVNFRLHPRDSAESVFEYVQAIVADEEVTVSMPTDFYSEASRISESQSEGFRQIEASVRSVYGDVIVAPGLTLGGTDSRHYGKLARNNFLFIPFAIDKSDLTRLHGINERLSVKNLSRAMAFYRHLLEVQ